MSQPRKKPKIVLIDDEPEDLPVREVPKQRHVPEPEVTPSQRPPKAPNRFVRPSIILTTLLALVALTVLAAFIFIPPKASPVVKAKAPESVMVECLGVQLSLDWGHKLDSLDCRTAALEDGQTIGDILTQYNVDYRHLIQVQEAAKDQGMPGISPGNRYHILFDQRDLQHPVMFAYEPGLAGYVIMNLQGQPLVHMHHRKVLAKQTRQLDVVIQSNLADAMYNRPSGLTLTRQLEEAVKYKVDLFYLAPGDQFQILYEETKYEGNVSEIGDLMAVGYRQDGQQNWAFSYADEFAKGFYDEQGRPMKSGFLMAPLEYVRISSPYDLKRIDPITHSGVRPHLGTDYAAPIGTPILAVGDGVVMNAENKGGNGNYVKLFHTDSIQTQYLHMSAFAEGIEPGVEVRQGQVIGFVGSTGRSTGPHVCFRYWKNGEQVDHRKEQNFGAGGLRGEALEHFNVRRDSLMSLMTNI